MEEKKEENWFLRSLIIAFLVLLTVLICLHFWRANPAYGISNGLIILVGIMTLVVLSEGFSSLSLGQFISLNKQVKEAEKDKFELRKDNSELRVALVNLATNVSQSQVTTNINGASIPMLQKVLGVIPAEDSSDKEKEEEIKHPLEGVQGNAKLPQPELRAQAIGQDEVGGQSSDHRFKRRVMEKLEDLLFEKFSSKYSLPLIEISRDVQFGSGAESIDPIMDRRTLFDGYIKTQQREYFIEVRHTGLQSVFIADRVYVMLAKILFYRQAKKSEAELVLLIPEMPETDPTDQRISSNRFFEWFKPAMSNNLLRVERFNISAAEYKEIQEQVKRNNPGV